MTETLEILSYIALGAAGLLTFAIYLSMKSKGQ